MNYDDEDDYDPTANIPKPSYSGTLEDADGHVNKKIKIDEQTPYQNNMNPPINYGNQYPYYPNMAVNQQPYMAYGQQMQQMPSYYNNFQWSIPQQTQQMHNQPPMQAFQQNFNYAQPISHETLKLYDNYGAVNAPQPYMERNVNKTKNEFKSTNNTSIKKKDNTTKKQPETTKISPKEVQPDEQEEKNDSLDIDDTIIDESSLNSESKNGNKVLIPGTSITLETDEDIEKWKEERRKMWLLRISNKRKEHMEKMGIKEEDIRKTGNPLRESKKEQQFIKNIQAQVTRSNPKANLNIKLVQRGFAEENAKLLDFIVELGDCGFLEYELTQEEKDKLFGGSLNNSNNNNNRNFNRGRRPYNQRPHGNNEGSRCNQGPPKQP